MQGKISPAFPNENVLVVFSADNAFCPYMAVMIESVIENRSAEKNYDILILHSDILESTKKQIISLANDLDNVMIRFIDVTPYFSNVNLFVDISDKRLTKETYYRLIIGEILDDSYEKAIYLDGDMVTLVDVSSLMDLELRDNYIAAAYDVTGIACCHREGDKRIEYRTKMIGMSNPDNYFIAGLLVFNLKKIRKDYPGKALVELAASRNWLQHDQDVLNYICRNGQALLLHPSWNVLQDYGNNHYLPSPLKEMWLESERNPKIIHYGGSGKPWKKNVVRQDYFWKYAVKTNFFPVIVCEMLRQELWEQWEQDITFVQKEIISNHIRPTRESIFAVLSKLAGETSITKHIREFMGNNYLQKYITARVDVKNLGIEENEVTVTRISDLNAKVQKPAWFKNAKGQGCVIQSTKGIIEIEIECIGNGELTIWLRGMDCRKENNIRFPVWINYTCLLINDEYVLNKPTLIWHDRPFVYKLHVTDKQSIKIHAEWQSSQDMIAIERETYLHERETYLKKNSEMEQEILKIQRNCKIKDQELKDLKQSRSYRIGRMITFIPRKLRDVFK